MTARTETFETVRERFLAHVRSRGTDASPAAVHEKLAGAYATFDRLIAQLSADTATGVPGPGEWSVHDVVDHLLETERLNLDELRCLVVGERPPGPAVEANLRSRAPHRRSWPWLVREITRFHRDIVEVAATGPDPSPGEPTAPAVIWAKVNAEPTEWIEELDWRAYAAVLRVHALEHLGQIQAILRVNQPPTATAARQSER